MAAGCVGELEQAGAVLSSQGELKKARRAFKQALKICRKLLESEPTHAGRQLDVAVGLERLGTVMSAQGESQEARESFQQALEIRQRLTERGADASGWWRREVTGSLNDLGIRPETERPLEALDLELHTARELLKRVPNNARLQREVSVRLVRLAARHLKLGIHWMAQQFLEESLAIMVRLTEQEPDNAQWLEDLGEQATMLGDVRGARSMLEGASSAYVLGLQARQKLAAREKDDARLQEAVCDTLKRLGLVLRAQQKIEEARRVFEQALEVRQQLVTLTPDNLGRQEDVAASFHLLGRVLSAQGHLEEASQALEQGLKIYQGLADKEPERDKRQSDLSVMHHALGAVLSAKKNWGEARQVCEQGLTLALQLAAREPGEMDWAVHVFISLKLLREHAGRTRGAGGRLVIPLSGCLALRKRWRRVGPTATCGRSTCW